MKLPTFKLTIRPIGLKCSLVIKRSNLFIILLLVFIFSGNNKTLLAKELNQPQSPDTEPPVVTITSPSTNENLNAGSMITILFRSTDNVGVIAQNVLISTDGLNFTTISNGLDGNITSLDIKLPMVATTNGTLRIEAIDAAGNVGFTLVRNITLIPDTEAPKVTIVAPQPGTKLKGNSMFTIVFNASDNVGFTSHTILIALDGKTFKGFISGIEGDERSALIQVPNIKAKTVLLRVISVDTAGNIGMADSGVFSIKRTK